MPIWQCSLNFIPGNFFTGNAIDTKEEFCEVKTKKYQSDKPLSEKNQKRLKAAIAITACRFDLIFASGGSLR